jgi:hypothetical protein
VSIEGSCHCGRIAFHVEGEPKEVSECNCSHCARKGFLLWFVTPDAFRVTAGDESQLTTYRFNTHNIEHKFCPVCGVQVFARGRTREGNQMVGVNLRAAPEFNRANLKILQVDGKSR